MAILDFAIISVRTIPSGIAVERSDFNGFNTFANYRKYCLLKIKDYPNRCAACFMVTKTKGEDGDNLANINEKKEIWGEKHALSCLIQ